MNYEYNVNKKVMIVLSAIILTILAAMIFSSGVTGSFLISDNSTDKISEPVQVCQNITEEYTELEPYNTEECVSVPRIQKSCNTSSLTYTLNKECYWSNEFKTINTRCTIQNTDTQEGTFVIEVGVINRDGKLYEQRSVSLYPQASSVLTYSQDADIANCYCSEVSIPTKEVCYDKIVTEEQCFDVTKYRTVSKERIVEKCD
ncbi:MAG: hypothetical protein PHU12_00475 [Candidatus Aenigmarchaeota archaeon]|nr:hypothetical protein [Candidatus Aenigmarchaeota archaeon]